MGLLNPFFLIGAVTLGVPVLIHLVRRERSEIIPFSSLMFLLKVPKQVVRQQKLKNLLLMLLRLLLLLLLVLAFTRPYLAYVPPKVGDKTKETSIVMLLDNSMSMRYGDHWDRLKAEARKKIDAMGIDDRMVIVAFNDVPTVMAGANATGTPWTSDKGQLKAILDTVELSYGGTQFYDAFTAAARYFKDMGGGSRKLIMISDFQRGGWTRASHENVIAKDVTVERVSVAEEKTMNIGIESVSAEATTFTRNYGGRVMARIRNYRAVEVPGVIVNLTVNGKKLDARPLTLPPNGSSIAEFTGFELPVGLSRAAINIENEDPLREDNEFDLALERRERLKVLLVDNGRTDESIQLRTALTAGGETRPFEVKTLPVNLLTPGELANHQVVIVNDVPRMSADILNRMAELRKTGQGQWIILAQNADLNFWGGVASLPVKPLRRIAVKKDRGQPSVSITNYDRNHPLFKLFEKFPKLTLNSAEFFAYLEVEPKQGATVLARFDDGQAFLTESKADDRGLLVTNSSAYDQAWNNWPLMVSFTPLVDETVRYLSRYNEVRSWYALGEGIAIPGSAEGSDARVKTPAGESESLGKIPPGQQRFYSATHPGFYDLQVGKDLRLFAVAPPAGEGNLEALDPEVLLDSVRQVENGPGGLGPGEGGDEYNRRSSWWWYLIVIAIAAGIVEILMANRTQRSQIEPRRA